MTCADAGLVPTLFVDDRSLASDRIHQCQTGGQDHSLTHSRALGTERRKIALRDGAEATEVTTAPTSVIVNRHGNEC